jgi:hypothetical protein
MACKTSKKVLGTKGRRLIKNRNIRYKTKIVIRFSSKGTSSDSYSRKLTLRHYFKRTYKNLKQQAAAAGMTGILLEI